MSYKVGDVVGKYTVTRDFDSANGGQCQWGFAEYGGEEFFIKKFLTPVYPGEKAPGSEKGKQKRRDQCHIFEKKQLAIIKALADCGNCGLVVRTIYCFRHGNDSGEHYFKISQKVDTSSLSDKVHTLDPKTRLFVMLTAAGAVSILHKNGIIHLDLKPDNILIQEYESRLIAKVIDFDSSILEGESTEDDTLVGDVVYYSPEFAQHIATSGKTPKPTKKSDIFSLGLIFCKYWSGKLPTFSSSYNYAHEAVLKGENLSIPAPPGRAVKPGEAKRSRLSGTLIKSETPVVSTDPLSAGIQQLIHKMLIPSPDSRLSIMEVHQNLKHLFHHGELLKLNTDKNSDEPKTKLNFGKNLRQ